MKFGLISAIAVAVLVAKVSCVAVFPYELRGTPQDSDGQDEAWIHMESPHCNFKLSACMKKGEITDVFGPGLSSEGPVTIWIEERDTFNNDDSNKLIIHKEWLTDLTNFLDWAKKERNETIVEFPLVGKFALKNDFASFIDDVPMNELLCVSPDDIIPNAKGAADAWQAYKLATEVAQAANLPGSETAGKIKDLKLCANEVFRKDAGHHILIVAIYSDTYFQEKYRNACIDDVFTPEERAKHNTDKEEDCKLKVEEMNGAKTAILHLPFVLGWIALSTYA